MATDNDTKLTRYTSAVTIVTADTMNKIYGGEFGYNETVDEFDPLVFGHVHDGKHEDGHASKILLTSGAHIRGYLGNANLGGTDGTTPAVRYSNILCYSDAVYGSPAARRAAAAAGGFDLEILAIPEYTEDPVTGERCYYLDLSNSAGGIDGSIQFNEAGAFSGNQDLFYDYTNERFGLGTNTPERKAHIVDNSNPPLRIEGIGAGSGTVLVVDGNGDIYSDATIGNQNLFDSVALNNAGGGTQTGDATITADTPTELLTLSAGTNITLDGNAANDTITISAAGDQDLFETVALNNAGGGTQTGDATITADTTTDTLTLSAGTNITLDGSAGSDTITISATTSSQDAYKFIDLAGNTSGDIDVDATIADDTLTLTGGTGIRLTGNTAGQSIEIDNTQQAFRTITATSSGTGSSSGADVVADQVNDILTIEAGDNIDVTLNSGSDKVTVSANIPAAENQFRSEWVDCERWFPRTGVPVDSFIPGIVLTATRDNLRESKYVTVTGPDQAMGVKVKNDITTDATAGLPDLPIVAPPSYTADRVSRFFLTTVLPYNSQLSGSGGDEVISGTHVPVIALTGTQNYPGSIQDRPTSCRITAYYVLCQPDNKTPKGIYWDPVAGDNLYSDGLIILPAPPVSHAGVQFEARLSVRSRTNVAAPPAADGTTNPLLDTRGDGQLLGEHFWNPDVGGGVIRTFDAQYAAPVPDGTIMSIDFSALPIPVNADLNDGLVSFRLEAYHLIVGGIGANQEGVGVDWLKLIGTRILWIWD